MGGDGRFTDDVSAPGGVFVRCDDIRMIEYLPDRTPESGASSESEGESAAR